MIYSIGFDDSKFQQIVSTAVVDEVEARLISERWSCLGGNDGWFKMTGLGEPVSKAEVEERMIQLISDYPGDLAFWLPPRELADIVPILDCSSIIAFNEALKGKAPELLGGIRNDGILVDYPWRLSECFIQKWLGDLKTQCKWPALKNLKSKRVEIEIHGAKYLVSDSSDFRDYRVNLFYCTNWQCGIVDRELSSGSWKNWGAGGLKARFYKVNVGREIVFKQPPSEGCFIFRIPEQSSQIFCSQIFKDAYDQCGLKGLVFKRMTLVER